MGDTTKVRKLAVALNGRGGFLIPCPHSLGGSGFLSLSNGKRHKKGVISYTGIDVSTMEVLDKLDQAVRRLGPDDDWLGLLASYFAALQPLKIGNVLTASCPDTPTNSVVLELVAKMPVLPRPRLP